MYTSLQPQMPIRVSGLYSFFSHRFEVGYSFRGEMHDFWEVVYVAKGKLCVTAGEQVYDLSEGELIVHPPMEFHNLFVSEPMGAQVVIFSFSAAAQEPELSQRVFSLDGFQKQTVARMFSWLDERKAQDPRYLEWYRSMDREDDARWFLSYMHLFENDTQALSMAASFVEQLMVSLADSRGRMRESSAAEAKLFRRAMDYLSTYADRSVSVEELAKVLSVSRSGLNRLFRKYAGVSVHRYCIMQKIKAATACLQSGLSVTETAHRLGFSNQSYFSACFKRETGMNPSEVRRGGPMCPPA